MSARSRTVLVASFNERWCGTIVVAAREARFVREKTAKFHVIGTTPLSPPRAATFRQKGCYPPWRYRSLDSQEKEITLRMNAIYTHHDRLIRVAIA